MGWSVDHIAGKNSQLVSHSDARWERSKEDFVSFYKGVAAEGSSLNAKSSSSTQYKEFYILSNQQFAECDVANEGTLGESGFTQLVAMCAGNTNRFGFNWYDDVKFSDVAVDGRVTWKNWFTFKLNLVTENAKSLFYITNDTNIKCIHHWLVRPSLALREFGNLNPNLGGCHCGILLGGVTTGCCVVLH